MAEILTVKKGDYVRIVNGIFRNALIHVTEIFSEKDQERNRKGGRKGQWFGYDVVATNIFDPTTYNKSDYKYKHNGWDSEDELLTYGVIFDIESIGPTFKILFMKG
jgi:hypothetical protein